MVSAKVRLNTKELTNEDDAGLQLLGQLQSIRRKHQHDTDQLPCNELNMALRHHML
jgi:hypothetical protein